MTILLLVFVIVVVTLFLRLVHPEGFVVSIPFEKAFISSLSVESKSLCESFKQLPEVIEDVQSEKREIAELLEVSAV